MSQTSVKWQSKYALPFSTNGTNGTLTNLPEKQPVHSMNRHLSA